MYILWQIQCIGEIHHPCWHLPACTKNRQYEPLPYIVCLFLLLTLTYPFPHLTATVLRALHTLLTLTLPSQEPQQCFWGAPAQVTTTIQIPPSPPAQTTTLLIITTTGDFLGLSIFSWPSHFPLESVNDASGKRPSRCTSHLMVYFSFSFSLPYVTI